MAKWKCEVCGNEFENFHAQGFDNKIYCPLCYFKKENQELKLELSGYRQAILEDKDMLGLKEESEELKKQLTTYKILHRDFKVDNLKNISKIEEMENQQKDFINYLEDEIKFHKNRDSYMVADIHGSYDLNDIELKLLEEILQKYKEITRGKDEKEN